MEIKNWHVNTVIRTLVLASFIVGVKFADKSLKASNKPGISMEESDGSQVLDEPLNQLQQAIVNKDLGTVKHLLTGNGFSLSDDEYKEFLNQFKTEGDAIRFVNVIRRQASDFAQNKPHKTEYYYADGTLEDVKFKINKITAELTFGTLGTAEVNEKEYNLNKDRIIEVKDLLPFNQDITAKVDNTWTDKETLNIFSSFIGDTVKTGDKLVVKGRVFDNGAGLIVHIDTNVDNGILYINGDRSNRTVMSGGCYRDRFKEGDKIRVEFGGKKSKEHKVSKDDLNTTLNIDLDEFMKPQEIHKEDNFNAKLTAKNFFRAVKKCVKHGNTKDLDELMAPGYETIAQQALSSYINTYSEISFSNIYYNSVNTDSRGNSNVSATFQYDAETLEDVEVKAEGAATIQLNSDNKIVGFTIN